jgi:nucleoside-diphosphate-sugar epimerase
VVLVRSSAAAERVVSRGATPIFGDLDDPASIDAAFVSANADVLLNIASLGFGHAPAIVAAAQEAGINKAVFVSTTGIFTNLNPTSKAVRVAAESTIAASGLKTIIVRPTMIYGAPGDRNMERLLALLRRTPTVPMPGGGKRLQQPIHVEDLAQVLANAVEGVGSTQGAFDVAGPEPLMFRDVVSQAAAAVGRHPRMFSVPLSLVRGAVSAQERLPIRTLIKLEQIDRLVEDKAFDITPAQSALGFAPRPFTDGISQEARLCRR